ncbi:MAG: flagellar basal body P-ring protein FlgI [Armatimonadetes bacterium]|nr:flagellar basal body P-ring protein FlgI [Armatimonadota bacterium]
MRIALYLLLALLALPVRGEVRLKDIANVQGVRGNQLVGYGLVVGLDGSGDSTGARFTVQSIANMLEKFGVTVSPGQLRVKNVAAVMVTADLPAFIKSGSRIDVVVSSLGDARSLQGGTLLLTPIKGPDGEVYAVAQGPLSIGGFNLGSGGQGTQKNHTTVGRIPQGAIVEQDVATTLSKGNSLSVSLHKPDFTTASRVAAVINEKISGVKALPEDAGTVRVEMPGGGEGNLIETIAGIEGLSVTPDNAARVIVNERTGTVVMGGNVRIMPVAIAHGSLSIQVKETPIVSQPPSFSGGTTVTTTRKAVKVKEDKSRLAGISETSTLEDVVRALNALGVTPRDLISVLQAIRAAGSLTAEIEVQ